MFQNNSLGYIIYVELIKFLGGLICVIKVDFLFAKLAAI